MCSDDEVDKFAHDVLCGVMQMKKTWLHGAHSRQKRLTSRSWWMWQIYASHEEHDEENHKSTSRHVNGEEVSKSVHNVTVIRKGTRAKQRETSEAVARQHMMKVFNSSGIMSVLRILVCGVDQDVSKHEVERPG